LTWVYSTEAFGSAMAKGSYPDSLCMIGRTGHFEDSINGVYTRVKGEAKKEDVRFFYEKTDGVLCATATRRGTWRMWRKPPRIRRQKGG
jgi:hypothetical protein